MDLDNRLRAALDRALADVRAAAEAEVDEVRRSAELSTATLRASAGRLSDCIHAVDDAPTLGSVLTVLAGCARLEAGRSAIVLVTNGTLTAYPSRAEVPSAHAKLAATAAEQRTAVVEPDAAAFPILVGGQAVAVLTTAAPSSAEAHQALDVLVRHAGRVLEGMTLSRIIGLTPALTPLPGFASESPL